MADPTQVGLIVFALNSAKDLSEKIARRLGVNLAPVKVKQFQNKETNIDIGMSVRGRDVFIIQSGQGMIYPLHCREKTKCNDALMELMIMSHACKIACARRIIGLTGIITMDLHSKEIQGFYNIPVDNLRASPFIVRYISESVPDNRNAVIVAKNPSSAYRATSFAERLRLGIAVIHGEQKDDNFEEHDGRNSPPPRAHSSASFSFDVASSGDVASLDVPGMTRVVVTNTVAHDSKAVRCSKIKSIDISQLLAEAIRRIHNGESMGYLFRNVPLED
ncbi:Phosphoribosyl pyrophosphate synthase-associated protein 2 [Exaiptasia diaphana]|nr:Phosphoribosyl pyrophosphate synthase-associated protein 2 [Exaiptasia diaphana]